MKFLSAQPRKLLLATAVSLLATAGISTAQAADDMKTVTERVSYIFGYNMGMRFKQDGVEVTPDVFVQAMKDAAAGKEPTLTEEEMKGAMRAFQDMQQARQAEAIKAIGDANKKEGEAFLAANAKKEGVKTTKSGLQYKVITAGKGAKPKSESQVQVHYKGTLINGTEFDSSHRRGEPAEFGVTQVIPGWTEALLMMTEGSKWEVYIPSELAYGSGGAGQEIGPNATLIFEIELLKIVK